MTAPPFRMDLEDFRAWEIAQTRKHELVGGVIKLKAAAMRAHLRRQMNLGSALNQRLRGKPLEALAEVKIIIPNKTCRPAGIAVGNGPQNPRDLVVPGPRVAFKVESKSMIGSETMDRLSDC